MIHQLNAKDLHEKNTILMIVYGMAAFLGSVAQLFIDRPIGVALSLIIPLTITLICYFIQRKVIALHPYFPYVVIIAGVLTGYGTIVTNKVTVATIILSIFVFYTSVFFFYILYSVFYNKFLFISCLLNNLTANIFYSF